MRGNHLADVFFGFWLGFRKSVKGSILNLLLRVLRLQCHVSSYLPCTSLCEAVYPTLPSSGKKNLNNCVVLSRRPRYELRG